MRLLLTRPQEDSTNLAQRLAERGHETLVEPLLTIRPDLGAALELDGVAALLFTSANGVRAFALRSARRDLPVYAVGEATAQSARELGFTSIESAGGDVEALARLVAERRHSDEGALLHVAGSVTAGDLAGTLRDSGFDVRRAVLYAAEPVHALSEACAAALREGRLDAAVFYSPRTATAFVTLAQAGGLADSVRRMTLVGMSEAVIEAARALPWKAAVAAAEPNEPSLIEAIDRLAASPAAGATPPRQSAAVTDPTPRRAGGALAALAVIVALAALGLAGWTAWRHWESPFAGAPPPPPDRGPAIAVLTERLARAEAALARPAAIDPARVAEAERSLGRVVGTIEQLAARIDALERAPQGGGGTSANESAALAALTAENRRLAEEGRRIAEDLGALRQEIARLAAAAAERARGREGLALALGQLREAVGAGRGYAAELTIARAAAGAEPGLDATWSALAAQAERGAPTLARLRADFPPVAAAIVRASVGADERDASWWRAALARIAAVVSVRRVGAVEGDGPEARAARAEFLLGEGDLAGAVATLEPLAGAPAAAAAPWLKRARARVAADAALAALARRALGG